MFTALVGSAFILAACGSPQEPSPPRAPAARPATVRLFASAASAPVGSRISVSLSGSTADGAPVLGIDGWLRFAPAALRFDGRAVDSTTTIAVNDSGAPRGRLRVLAVRPGRLEPDVPVLVFEVLQADYLATLEFEPRAVVGAARQLHRSSGSRRAEVRNSLSAPGAVRAAAQRGKALKQLVTPTIYGDADGSGAVAHADADLVGDWIVGNGAPPDTMTFNLANVAPQNLPGIGGSTDEDPPGWGFLFLGGGFVSQAALTDPPISQGCDRGLAVDDLLLIAQEAGGTNVEVPGEVMPAGTQRPARCGTGSWPTLTTTYPSFDTTRLASTASGAEFYRTAASLTFQVSATDQEKLAVVSKHSLTVVGVTPSGSVFVTFPDPGPAIADLWRLMDSLRSEPAVAGAGAVLRSPLEEGSFGRYPEDGAGLNRTSWTGSSTSTWALRAIRAPLAWGCETGTYSASRVRTGIVEWKHDRDHPELSLSTPVLWEPSDSNLQNETPKPADTVAARRAHATHVAGAMAAIGDNGSGVAGVIWRTDLRLYSVYSNGSRPLPLTTAFYVLTDAIQADRPVVLGLSIDGILPGGLPQAQKDYWIDNTVVYLKELLQAVPEMIVVVASGNERFRGTASAYEQGVRVALVRAALLRLRGDPVFGPRIVVVAGTRPGNNLWDVSLGDPSEGSNVFAGLTDIAAPAESVLVLGLRSGQSSPLVFKHGTSLAAPMVAGVAGQLLAMDPTLTPSQLKRYIVEGAQQPKPDAATGAVTPAQPVQGAAQTIYQLDAYSSLTLLARERETTPICGFLVTTELLPSDPVTGLRSVAVLLQRPGFQPREVYRGDVANVTVAQGGRLIGIEEFTSASLRQSRDLRYGGGVVWTPSAPEGYVGDRQFLERDTAYTILATPTTPTTIQIRGPGRSELFRDVCAGLGGFIPADVRGCAPGTISPAGDWVGVVAAGSNFDQTGCGPGKAGQAAYLVRLAGGTGVRVIREVSYDPCAWATHGTHVFPLGDVFAWRPDGAFAWIGSSNETLVSSPNPDTTSAVPLITRLSTETRYVAEAVVSGVSTPSAYTQADWVAEAMAGQADGAHLIVYEDNREVGGPRQCRRVRRAFGAPSQATVDGPITCFQLMEPLPVNLRAPQLASRNVSGPIARGGILMAPFVQWMERVQGRRAPRVVIAN